MNTERYHDYIDTQVEQGQLSPGTRRMYNAAIERFAEFLPHDGEPTVEDMMDYLLARASDDGVSGSTLNVDKCALGKLLSLKARGGDYQTLKLWFSDNFRVSSGTTNDFYTDEEMGAIREAAEADPRDEAMVALFSRTGMRVGELIRLSLSDVNLSPEDPAEGVGGYVTISREKRREEVEQRRSITVEDAEILRRYLDARAEYAPEAASVSNGLFLTPVLTDVESDHIPSHISPDVGTGTYRPTDSAIRKWMKQLAERADHPDVTPERMHPHLFRHTVGTRLGKEGYSASQIGAYLGKASPAERYTNFGTEDADEMAKSLV